MPQFESFNRLLRTTESIYRLVAKSGEVSPSLYQDFLEYKVAVPVETWKKVCESFVTQEALQRAMSLVSDVTLYLHLAGYITEEAYNHALLELTNYFQGHLKIIYNVEVDVEDSEEDDASAFMVDEDDCNEAFDDYYVNLMVRHAHIMGAGEKQERFIKEKLQHFVHEPYFGRTTNFFYSFFVGKYKNSEGDAYSSDEIEGTFKTIFCEVIRAGLDEHEPWSGFLEGMIVVDRSRYFPYAAQYCRNFLSKRTGDLTKEDHMCFYILMQCVDSQYLSSLIDADNPNHVANIHAFLACLGEWGEVGRIEDRFFLEDYPVISEAAFLDGLIDGPLALAAIAKSNPERAKHYLEERYTLSDLITKETIFSALLLLYRLEELDRVSDVSIDKSILSTYFFYQVKNTLNENFITKTASLFTEEFIEACGLEGLMTSGSINHQHYPAVLSYIKSGAKNKAVDALTYLLEQGEDALAEDLVKSHVGSAYLLACIKRNDRDQLHALFEKFSHIGAAVSQEVYVETLTYIVNAVIDDKEALLVQLYFSGFCFDGVFEKLPESRIINLFSKLSNPACYAILKSLSAPMMRRILGCVCIFLYFEKRHMGDVVNLLEGEDIQALFEVGLLSLSAEPLCLFMYALTGSSELSESLEFLNAAAFFDRLMAFVSEDAVVVLSEFMELDPFFSIDNFLDKANKPFSDLLDFWFQMSLEIELSKPVRKYIAGRISDSDNKAQFMVWLRAKAKSYVNDSTSMQKIVYLAFKLSRHLDLKESRVFLRHFFPDTDKAYLKSLCAIEGIDYFSIKTKNPYLVHAFSLDRDKLEMLRGSLNPDLFSCIYLPDLVSGKYVIAIVLKTHLYASAPIDMNALMLEKKSPEKKRKKEKSQAESKPKKKYPKAAQNFEPETKPLEISLKKRAAKVESVMVRGAAAFSVLEKNATAFSKLTFFNRHARTTRLVSGVLDGGARQICESLGSNSCNDRNMDYVFAPANILLLVELLNRMMACSLDNERAYGKMRSLLVHNIHFFKMDKETIGLLYAKMVQIKNCLSSKKSTLHELNQLLEQAVNLVPRETSEVVDSVEFQISQLQNHLEALSCIKYEASQKEGHTILTAMVYLEQFGMVSEVLAIKYHAAKAFESFNKLKTKGVNVTGKVTQAVAKALLALRQARNVVMHEYTSKSSYNLMSEREQAALMHLIRVMPKPKQKSTKHTIRRGC